MNDKIREEFEKWWKDTFIDTPYQDGFSDVYKPSASLASVAWESAIQSEEVQKLRKALESIVECCEEHHASRDYVSRQTEILGIARFALKEK